MGRPAGRSRTDERREEIRTMRNRQMNGVRVQVWEKWDTVIHENELNAGMQKKQ